MSWRGLTHDRTTTKDAGPTVGLIWTTVTYSWIFVGVAFKGGPVESDLWAEVGLVWSGFRKDTATSRIQWKMAYDLFYLVTFNHALPTSSSAF